MHVSVLSGRIRCIVTRIGCFKRRCNGFSNEPASTVAASRFMVFGTFPRQWMMSGGDLFKSQRILGHRSADMTQLTRRQSAACPPDDYRAGRIIGNPARY